MVISTIERGSSFWVPFDVRSRSTAVPFSHRASSINHFASDLSSDPEEGEHGGVGGGANDDDGLRSPIITSSLTNNHLIFLGIKISTKRATGLFSRDTHR